MIDEKDFKKYRILLVIRWPIGGIRTFIKYVYNHFDRSLFHFTILAPDQPEIRILLKDLKCLDLSFIPVNSVSSNLIFLKTIIKTILTRKFDLIHSHGFTSAICTVLPARLRKIKHILTLHDLFNAKQFVGLKGYLSIKVLFVVLSMTDIIHSVSYDAQNNLLEYFPALERYKQKLLVIPTGIEIECFKGQEKRDLHKELNLPSDTFVIGFLGRFMSPKGFIYLVEAMELLLKTRNLPKQPVIVALGYGAFIREEKECVKKKGLDKFVHFLPFVPNVAPTLRGVDVVTMPSIWEACGILSMEAMVSGVPFIGTDCLGLREVLKNTPCAIVPKANSAALAEALIKEIKNPSKSKAEAFRNEAMLRFDVKKQAAELEKVMLKLIKQK